MKKNFLFAFMLFIVPALTIVAQEKPEGQKDEPAAALAVGPKASWDKTTFKMGEVKYKTHKDAVFTLTNGGNEPLLITYARSSCGCTVLDYPEAPILPGKSIKIKVTYDGTGKGKFRKMVSIMTNADERPTALQIVGEVVMN